MRIRECNYPKCKKNATMIIPFGCMGGTDAYCEEHYNKREKFARKYK